MEAGEMVKAAACPSGLSPQSPVPLSFPVPAHVLEEAQMVDLHTTIFSAIRGRCFRGCLVAGQGGAGQADGRVGQWGKGVGRHRKMRPLPATASQEKPYVPS